MEIGISSFAFGWAVSHGLPPMDEIAVLEFARRHRLRVMQLGDNLPVHAMSAERRAVFLRELEEEIAVLDADRLG